MPVRHRRRFDQLLWSETRRFLLFFSLPLLP